MMQFDTSKVLPLLEGKDDLVDFVRANGERLTANQRAFVAAHLTKQSRYGAGLSMIEAATLFGVTPRMMKSAGYVRKWATAEEVVEMRNGTISVEAVETRIRRRKRGLKINPPRQGGRMPAPPDGLTVEDWCRKGMAMEPNCSVGSHQRSRAEVVSVAIGMSTRTYRMIKEMIELKDRSDLSPKDAATVAGAIEQLNATRLLMANYKLVEPLAQRVRGKSRSFLPQNRSRNFDTALGVVIQACLSASVLEIPHLSPEQSKSVIVELGTAKRNLETLITKVKDVYQ